MLEDRNLMTHTYDGQRADLALSHIRQNYVKGLAQLQDYFTQWFLTMFGLDQRTLRAIEQCLQSFPHIQWVKVYGSRAMGNYQRGSDIDLAYSCSVDCSAQLHEALDALPTPYLFDVTHYESLSHAGLKAHIERVGVLIFQRQSGGAS